MSRENWGWRPAEEAVEWALATGVVGWVSAPEIAEAVDLEHELAALRSRRDALSQELATAVAAARAEAMATSQHEVEALLDRLAARPREASRRTAMLAMLVAEVMLGRLAEGEERVVQQLLDRALAAVAGEQELLVRAGPRIAELVRQRVALAGESVQVRPDGTLAGADVVVEFARGQLDGRLRSQIALLESLLEACPDDLS